MHELGFRARCSRVFNFILANLSALFSDAIMNISAVQRRPSFTADVYKSHSHFLQCVAHMEEKFFSIADPYGRAVFV